MVSADMLTLSLRRPALFSARGARAVSLVLVYNLESFNNYIYMYIKRWSMTLSQSLQLRFTRDRGIILPAPVDSFRMKLKMGIFCSLAS